MDRLGVVNGWISGVAGTILGLDIYDELEYSSATRMWSQSSLFGEGLSRVIGLSYEVDVESIKFVFTG